MKKSIISKIRKEADDFGVPFWRLPDFLILMMAVINISGMLFTYYFALGFVEDPRSAVLFVAIEAVVILIIGYVIAESSRKVISNYRLKEEFIDLISHQIRGPVTSMRWNLELLLKEKATEKQTRYMERINGSVENISSLVNDFVYLSRLKQAKKEIKLQKIDFKDLIKEVLKEVQIIVFSKNIKFNLKVKTKNNWVQADKKRIKIVVSNIIENAFKYSFEKGEIEISLFSDKENIILTVKDDGCGIDKKSRPFIFDKFYRSESAKKFVADGTGVGLYVSRVLLEEMNGKIWFDSEENKGSTFYLSLPKA